jgi:hypothetical protein
MRNGAAGEASLYRRATAPKQWRRELLVASNAGLAVQGIGSAVPEDIAPLCYGICVITRHPKKSLGQPFFRGV